MTSFGVTSNVHGACAKRPIFLAQRSSEWLTTTAVGLGIFTDSFIYSVMIPILPYYLHTRGGIPKDSLQIWTSATIASYGAALLISSPMIGLFADNTKARRWPYISSLFMLLGATVLQCFGQNIFILIMARAFQGVSAATVWVIGLALLVDSVGTRNIARAMGFAALGSSTAILIGPMVGGVVYDRAGLYGIFYICLGLIITDLSIRLILVEKRVAASWLSRDGSIKKSIPSREMDPGKPLANIPFSRRGRAVLSLLASGRFLSAIFSTIISAILISTFDAIVPLHVQNKLGLSSIGAGLIFAAVIIPNSISPFNGWLCDRYGARWIVSSGYILFFPFLFCLRFVKSGELSQLILFCGLLSGVGLCYSAVTIPIMSEYARVVAQKEALYPGIFGSRGAYAQAYGLYNMAYSGGILIGPLWGGLCIQKFGWAALTTSLAICCSLTAIITGIWCGKGEHSSTGVDKKEDMHV